jgi:geranylgeranyl reductase family protein
LKNEDFIESYSFGGIAYSSLLKYKLEIQKTKPLASMVLRKKFDNELVKLAVDTGTVFLDDTYVKDVKILNDKARIITDDGSDFTSRIVIGADGIWSVIASKSGLRQKHKNFGMCLYQEYVMKPGTLDSYFTEQRLCHIHSKLQGIAGYGWVFPKKEHVNIGIGEITPVNIESKKKTNLKELYKTYITILKKSKIIPDNLKIGKLKGGALPVTPLEKTYSDRIVLCGDAAGFINPISGEGIYYAMSSGEIAASVISEALEEEKTNENFLYKYQKRWKNDFGKDIKFLSRAAKKWTKGEETFIKLASKDNKLANMALNILYGDLSIYKYRWKLINRYLYLYFKQVLNKIK